MVTMQEVRKKTEKIGMLLLALYPILYYYSTSLPFSYGQLLFFAFFIVQFFYYAQKPFSIPKEMTAFWIYAAIVLLFFSPNIKVTYFVPGGIQFCVWIIILGLCIRNFNRYYLQKYMRIIFVISAVIYVLQELMFMRTGTRFVTILPISETFSYGGLTYSGLMEKQINANRSSSLFMEPAYFAQYALCLLALELFCDETKDKLVTKYSLLIIFILLILRSGVGVIGLLLLGLIKFFTSMKNYSLRKNLLYLFLLLPIVLTMAFYYSQSEIGLALLGRADELGSDESSGYLRLFYGYYIYELLPMINKIFGLPIDALENIMPSYITTTDESIFMNGFQTLLITNGLIGVILFCYVFVKFYKKGRLLIKSSVWLLLLLSLMEQIYLMPYMLLLSVIIFSNQEEGTNPSLANQSKIYKNYF